MTQLEYGSIIYELYVNLFFAYLQYSSSNSGSKQVLMTEKLSTE